MVLASKDLVVYALACHTYFRMNTQRSEKGPRDDKAQVPRGLETVLSWGLHLLGWHKYCLASWKCVCFSRNKCNEAIQIFELWSQEQQSL